MPPSPFMEMLRSEMRLRGNSLRTEKSYLYWIRQYIRFHNLTHPSEMGAEHVKSFLSWLACERYVAVNTQKVAQRPEGKRMSRLAYAGYLFKNLCRYHSWW